MTDHEDLECFGRATVLAESVASEPRSIVGAMPAAVERYLRGRFRIARH